MDALTMALSPLQSSVNSMNDKLDNVSAHLGRLERCIDMHNACIGKLEEAINNPEGFLTDPAITLKLEELQAMVNSMRDDPGYSASAAAVDPNPLSAVIGGLKGLSFEEACKWLELKLQQLQGPSAVQITKRAENFNGVVFVGNEHSAWRR